MDSAGSGYAWKICGTQRKTIKINLATIHFMMIRQIMHAGASLKILRSSSVALIYPNVRGRQHSPHGYTFEAPVECTVLTATNFILS